MLSKTDPVDSGSLFQDVSTYSRIEPGIEVSSPGTSGSRVSTTPPTSKRPGPLAIILPY